MISGSAVTTRDDKIAERMRLLLCLLGRMPFLTAQEAAPFIGTDRFKALRALRGLERQELANHAYHQRSRNSRAYRWHLTEEDIAELARADGASAERLLARLPVSAEWMRSLLRRLEAVDLLYRIASDAAAQSDMPPEWRWYRAGAFDAAMLLDTGKSFTLLRFGGTMSWQATKSRLGSIIGRKMHERNPAALLIVPGEIELKRIIAFMRDYPAELFITTESALASASTDAEIWRSRRDKLRMSLTEVFALARTRSHMPPSERYLSETTPLSDAAETTAPADMLATELAPRDREMLRLLYDWPLLRGDRLARMMNIAPSSLKTQRSKVTKLGLVHLLRLGRTQGERAANGTRLALSDAGRNLLAKTDRRRQSELASHWRVAFDEAGHPEPAVEKHRLHGSKTRTLARELRHTDGAHEFTAMLFEGARASSAFELVEALPPHRWERFFRTNEGKHAFIRPDATYALNYQGRRVHYFLEYEHRANIPVRMRQKIDIYERYYAPGETRHDFDGVRPTCLIVFPTSDMAARFVRLLAIRRGRECLMLVSSMDVLGTEGIFGRSWLRPRQLERGRLHLASLLR